jgi:hypothetical protein
VQNVFPFKVTRDWPAVAAKPLDITIFDYIHTDD